MSSHNGCGPGSAGHNDGGARVSHHPSQGFHKCVKTMQEYNETEQECIALERDVRQLNATALAERTPECHDCCQVLTEGTEVILCATQSPTEAIFELSQVKCREHGIEQNDGFNSEWRELIVEGRVGRCSDHSRQTSWPVLLHPQIRLISPVGTTKGNQLRGESGFRTAIGTSEPIDAYRELCWRTEHPPRSTSEPESDSPMTIHHSVSYQEDEN